MKKRVLAISALVLCTLALCSYENQQEAVVDGCCVRTETNCLVTLAGTYCWTVCKQWNSNCSGDGGRGEDTPMN